ncbi:MAG TPA: SgcJ/EcaC family oxidoreductase [Chloroflexota bacterium]|nr:SgcJ/EcaC family oxidoreductase [Chloroflexota bacterium]
MANSDGAQGRQSGDEAAVRALYRQLLDDWNRRSAGDMASRFSADGNMVGFDGSPVNGRAEIEGHLAPIFRDHPTAAFVAKVREVRFVTPEVAILRGVAGMVPPGQSDLNPAANAVQTLVAARRDGRWQVELFQNTPAAFHGRPELSQALTEELRRALATGG